MPSLRSFPSMPPSLEEEGHNPSDSTAEGRGSNPLGSTLALCGRFTSRRPLAPRSSSRERNGVPLLVLGVVVGSRNLEAAARSLTTVAPLVDGHARYLVSKSRPCDTPRGAPVSARPGGSCSPG